MRLLRKPARSLRILCDQFSEFDRFVLRQCRRGDSLCRRSAAYYYDHAAAVHYYVQCRSYRIHDRCCSRSTGLVWGSYRRHCDRFYRRSRCSAGADHRRMYLRSEAQAGPAKQHPEYFISFTPCSCGPAHELRRRWARAPAYHFTWCPSRSDVGFGGFKFIEWVQLSPYGPIP